ncbi:MAG TPA: carbon storage regulator [Deltaproteobacteria bacterium]|nr:carbon storage regulator [Deltaproteobacteria bacterium]
MLVLTRRQGESVRIGPDVRVTVVASTGGQVRIAIDAPEEVAIFREEIFERVASANVEAASNVSTNLSGLGSKRGFRAMKSGGMGNG